MKYPQQIIDHIENAVRSTKPAAKDPAWEPLAALPCSAYVDLEDLRQCLAPIAEAQKMLEDNYPIWNQAGKDHAVKTAAYRLRVAYSHISKIYGNSVYPQNAHVQPRQNQSPTNK